MSLLSILHCSTFDYNFPYFIRILCETNSLAILKHWRSRITRKRKFSTTDSRDESRLSRLLCIYGKKETLLTSRIAEAYARML